MEKFLTIKSIFNRLKFHPFFYFVFIIALFTGHFKSFIIFMSVILFHELGHILMGLLFRWKIEKIIILPFGGLTVFDEYINRPILEEFLVCLGGPFFQIIYYFFISNFIDIANMHYSLLFFNLLPIIPLDGSKIVNLFFNKLLPFYFSNLLTNIVSVLVSFICLFVIINASWNLILFCTISLLVFKTIVEIKNTNYIFNKFLLERYVKHLNIDKVKRVNGLNLKKMYRDYKHIFVCEKKCYTEREIIRKRFDLQGKVW